MWEVAPKWWYSAFAAADDAVKKNPALYIDFMTAVIKAERFMYANRDKTIEIGVKYTKEDQDAVARAYDDLAKGGIWSVNDGMPRDMVEYTIGKKWNWEVSKPPRNPRTSRSSISRSRTRRSNAWAAP